LPNCWTRTRSPISARDTHSHSTRRTGRHCAPVSRTLEPLDASQHLLGNTVVDVDGDDATSICYFQAQHVRAGTPGGDTYFIAGSYADRLVRTPQGWRIAERVQAYLWRDGNRAVVAR